MSKIPRIFFDSAVFIDLAKHKAELVVDDAAKRNVWFTQKILAASRDKELNVITSIITVAECTHLKEANRPIPSPEVRSFFDSLLCSGKAGVMLTQATYSIVEKARDLRWIHGITLKGMDSIQAASAIERDCVELLTTDNKFFTNAAKLQELGLRVCQPCETKLLPEKYRQFSILDEDDAAVG